MSFEDFAARTGKTVILGDPGAGKSTTSTLLARQAFDCGRVPLVIRLKNVDVDRDGFNLDEVVEGVLRTRYQCPAPPGAVRRLLVEGRAFLVFDGLDELVDTTARETAAQTIDAVAALYPFSHILVTSRRVGYSVARLDTELFDEFLIGSFDQDQVREYARRWFTLVREPDDPPVDSTVRGFLESGQPISDLRANPLMLAFICILYQGRGTIPHKRPEIFRQCVELFLHRWDGKRGIGSPPANLDLVELALSYVAHAMLTDRRYRDGVTEDQVFDLVVDPLLEEGVPDRRGARHVVRELLDLCRGRAWIFTDVGDDRHGDEVFHFTHASFLEYFAALHVNRTTDRPEDVAGLLVPEIAAGRWEVLGQVCISLRLRSARAGAARVMDSILGHVESVMARRRESPLAPRWSPHDEDVALVEFLLRASETLPMSSETLRRLVEISADHFTLGRSNGLSALLNTDYQYVDAAYGKLVDLLSSSIRSYTRSQTKLTRARAWFAAHLGYLADQPLAHHVDLHRINDTRARLVTPDVLNLLAARKSTLAWNLRLHIGGDLDTADPLSFVRLFEGCHSPIPDFGPRSTIEWIVDCLSSPMRAGLPTATAVRLLRQVTHAASTDNDLPIGGEAHLLPPDVLEVASARVVGYDDDVLAGWCTVVMGVHELWEVATATPREQLLLNGNLNRLFTHAISRGVPGSSRIGRWRAGAISFWKHPAMSVS